MWQEPKKMPASSCSPGLVVAPMVYGSSAPWGKSCCFSFSGGRQARTLSLPLESKTALPSELSVAPDASVGDSPDCAPVEPALADCRGAVPRCCGALPSPAAAPE